MQKAYPEPWQLKNYADDPMVFTDVNDLELQPDGTLTGGKGVIEYTFSPDFIRITPERGDDEPYEASQNPDVELDHAGVWNRKIETTVEANTVSVTTFTCQLIPEDETALVEAFWSLSQVSISA